MCKQTIAIEALEFDAHRIHNDTCSISRDNGYTRRVDWYMSEQECIRMRDDIEDMLDIDGDLYTDLECDTIFTHLEEEEEYKPIIYTGVFKNAD